MEIQEETVQCPALSVSTFSLETGPLTEPGARLVASKAQEQGHTQMYMATFWESVFKDLCLQGKGFYQPSHPKHIHTSTKRVFCIIFCVRTLILHSLIVGVKFKSVALSVWTLVRKGVYKNLLNPTDCGVETVS